MNSYYNPKTKKTEELFESLNPVFTVSYENSLIGDDNESISITLEADNENQAKEKAMETEEFTKYIFMEYFDEKYLHAYKPTGLYVIGKINYIGGIPRA